MSRTRTLFINLERLQSNGKSATTIIRLMMACNDISVANQCLSISKEEQSPIRKHVKLGALMYFVRLQCGHLNEALKIIEDIKDDKYLHNKIENCSDVAKEAFKRLSNCLKGESDHTRFLKYVEKIRHKTIFHYDSKLIEKALSDRASRPETCRSKITMGDHISLSRFELADDIGDSIVCRYIWKIPREADLRQEADRISDYGSDLCRSLLDFGGEFIYRYVEDYSC